MAIITNVAFAPSVTNGNLLNTNSGTVGTTSKKAVFLIRTAHPSDYRTAFTYDISVANGTYNLIYLRRFIEVANPSTTIYNDIPSTNEVFPLVDIPTQPDYVYGCCQVAKPSIGCYDPGFESYMLLYTYYGPPNSAILYSNTDLGKALNSGCLCILRKKIPSCTPICGTKCSAGTAANTPLPQPFFASPNYIDRGVLIYVANPTTSSGTDIIVTLTITSISTDASIPEPCEIRNCPTTCSATSIQICP